MMSFITDNILRFIFKCLNTYLQHKIQFLRVYETAK